MKHQKLFNENSENYSTARPLYPVEIYHFLASVCEKREAAWDGACGNGQAAVGLAEYFDLIEASDISRQQIAHAKKHPRVNYSVQASEETNFGDNRFDLICIAQALHWFDFGLFWPEVKRVLKPGGIFAAWGYSWFSIEEGIDGAIQENLLEHLKPYWAPQNKLLWDHYQDIPFPFRLLEFPDIEMKMDWGYNQLISYLESWSAVRLCIEENGADFFDEVKRSVRSLWGDESCKKIVDMDFCMLVGKNEPRP